MVEDSASDGGVAQPERVAHQEQAGLFGRLSRRDVLRYSAGATAAVALPGVLEAGPAAASRFSNALHKRVSLTSREMTTLKAVLAQLLPKDDLGPGAVEAGVHIYIDKALADAYKALLPAYQKLLPMFDKAATSMGAQSFSGLAASHQISLLKQLEAGKAPGLSASDQKTAASTFPLLLTHMREGMFADPMYGGNQALGGWDLIGYPGVKLVYTTQEQAIGTKLPPAKKTAKSYGGSPFNGPYI